MKQGDYRKRRQDEKENHDNCAKYGNTSDSSFVHKLWKIKKPDSKFIGQKQLPYVGITITKGLTVVDTLGRYLIIDMDTGKITDMFCNRF